MSGESPRETIISVVVPCLGHADVLADCLRALQEQDITEPFEVIVVDSASDDAVAKVVSHFPDARLVRSDQRLAPGTARNLGVTIASSELLAFTDADCQPEPGFLAAAVTAMKKGARATTGPILDVAAGYIPACDNVLQFVDFPQSRPAGVAEYAPGCNLGLHKDDFLAVGGFPDGHAEDSRFCVKLSSRWPDPIVFNPAMRVRHLGRRTIPALLKHHRDFGYQRAYYDVRLTDRQSALGRYRVALPAIVLKKLSYLYSRTLKIAPQRLLFLAIALPLVLLGAIAWSQGFRAGLVARYRN